MRVLFIGDIVGPSAVHHVAGCLPALRHDHAVDLVIANAENCAPSGSGMTSELVGMLFDAGVDTITGGNHSWDGAEAEAVLGHPCVLRPANVPAGLPGQGIVHLTVADEPVTILNLADADALRLADAVDHATPLWSAWQAADRRGTVIVDIHAEHVIHKQIFAHAVDGAAAAVLGTHTHDPTLTLRILPGGTALVTEVGMTGPSSGVMGFDPTNFVEGFKQDTPFALPLPLPADSPIELGAVLLDIEANHTQEISRIARMNGSPRGANPAEPATHEGVGRHF